MEERWRAVCHVRSLDTACSFVTAAGCGVLFSSPFFALLMDVFAICPFAWLSFDAYY